MGIVMSTYLGMYLAEYSVIVIEGTLNKSYQILPSEGSIEEQVFLDCHFCLEGFILGHVTDSTLLH